MSNDGIGPVVFRSIRLPTPSANQLGIVKTAQRIKKATQLNDFELSWLAVSELLASGVAGGLGGVGGTGGGVGLVISLIGDGFSPVRGGIYRMARTGSEAQAMSDLLSFTKYRARALKYAA